MPARILKRRFVDADVLTLARERVRRAFDLYDHIAVSFSGGKDSTVCLNLALEEARTRGRTPLDVFFYDEEAIPYQTEEYARRVAAIPDVSLRWLALSVRHRNACSRSSPWWHVWNPDERDLWVRPMPPEAITDIPGFRRGYTIPESAGLLFDPADHGAVGMLMGIRAQESLMRQAAVSRRREENYLIKYDDITSRGNVWKVYPIYDWRTEDVWTAPGKLGWDYNRAYDLMDKAGIPPHAQRCAPPYGEEPLASLWMFKACFPELWDRMCERVPGAATAARYSRTELYNFGGRPEKPSDMSWQDFILHYLHKHDPDSRRLIARRLKEEMDDHYSKTPDPILADTPHPLTGVSWVFLLQIAMRGDFKHRRKATKHVIGKDRDLLRERYETAAAQEVGRW